MLALRSAPVKALVEIVVRVVGPKTPGWSAGRWEWQVGGLTDGVLAARLTSEGRDRGHGLDSWSFIRRID